MRDEYDFSDAKRENPYINKIQQHGYAIIVNCGAAQNSLSDTDNDNIPITEMVAENKTEYKRVHD